MSKDNIKTFTTGEFAKRFGIKKDTLFYYDRIGLFHPAIVSEKGYRYYTYEQLDIFWMIQSLRELNFPINALQHYINAPSAEKLVQLSKEQRNRVEEEMKKLEQIHWLLNTMVTYSEEALHAPLDELSLHVLPDEHILYSAPLPPNTAQLSSQEWFEFTEQFLKEAQLKGPAYAGSIVSKKDIEAGIFERVDRLFVRRQGPKSQLRPGGLYAITYHKGYFESPKDIYVRFIQKIKEQGLTICGDAYEEYPLDKLAVQDPGEFMIKISIPVAR